MLAILSLAACSRKKNKWVNRNFHAMGAYYNIIYNGQLALDEGKAELEQNYRDNYWEILPVERMQITKKDPTDTTQQNPKFKRAEEKATKAIQKHNMLIAGTEYNPQMDKAFILLGKSRYYDQRFFPALEAFNYVLTNYPKSDQLITAKIWREKTYMRMDNNELALENLQKLFKEKLDFEEKDYVEANAAMAQAYLNLGEMEKALPSIDTAIKYTDSHEQEGRLLFIRGQIYERLNQLDSANASFDRVIELNRKSPRVYMINAYMQKAKNFDIDEGDHLAFLELMEEMQENRENRPFLDIIYYQFAQYYNKTDTIPKAVTYYNKSLRTDTQDEYLRSRNYLTLGNINFDLAEYKEAGAYYDSTLTNLAENTREYRAIKKKRENLDDVILYEEIAQKNDSILQLVALPKAEQEAYFQQYADSLKAIAIEEAKKADKGVAQNTGSGNLFGKQQSQVGSQQSAGDFYFYDKTQADYGEQQFKSVWGDIELTDDWRYDPQTKNGGDAEAAEVENDLFAQIEQDPKYDPQTYIAKLPTDQKLIDSLSDERNFAYYQLGIIYKEKFKEYDLASDKLEALLTHNPEERLVLPSKYNLYKIYSTTGNTAKAEQWKQDILTNHPDSRYATILKNPRGLLNEEDSPEAVYTSVYRKYQAEKYKEVIDDSKRYITEFTGMDIVPKFELLKATAEGKYYGFQAYKDGLNYVALNYPQSEEGKRAEEIVSTALPDLENSQFKPDTPEDSYKLIYPFASEKTEEVQALKEKIEKALVELKFENLRVSVDFYNPETTFVTIHGLSSKMGAIGFGDKLKEEEDYEITHESFGISSSNYEIIQVHKNLDTYLEQNSSN
ncbi:type IX secretion system periplasmic lipoprotein PorW/SprE [Mesonia maritima]|uniref:Tetratricopeptide (TPR) repeat protein n=1 Tax=Mesonia maritima TaxID=1793873 RepID=A0ABU1K3F8_9FLAO|nr:tetratricopeptide repeat protein [Mesonia maritima]MDR6299841.1 tetratricopeptide (TPR) repeat protein [Mesonia maritima]